MESVDSSPSPRVRYQKRSFKYKYGAITVPVYYTPTGDYEGWTFYDKVKGRRVYRGNYAGITAEVHRYAITIAQGRKLLTPVESAEYHYVMDRLKGQKLGAVIEEYIHAKELLAGRITLANCAKHWNDTAKGVKLKTVPEVVRELLDTLELDAVSKVHLDELRSRLGRFSKTFPGPISDLNGPDIEDWLRRIASNLRTRLNFYRAVSNLMNFAKRRRYLPKGYDEMETIRAPKPPIKKPNCYSPEQFEKALRQAEALGDANQCLYLILRGMLGVRDSETFRLDAKQVVGDNLIVELGQGKVKKRPRLIPLRSAAKKWLAKYAPKEGKLIVYYDSDSTFGNATRRIFNSVGIKPLKNGLRHSYISYRMAQTKNAAAVSDEAGNSPQKVKDTYRDIRLPDERIITEELADIWFSIEPDEKVIYPPPEIPDNS